MGGKGPAKMVSFSGRFTLDDDGETPDLQECLYEFPGFMMTMGVREANAYRNSSGSVVMGKPDVQRQQARLECIKARNQLD